MAAFVTQRLPLCPTCFERVAAWKQARCPACSKDSTVASCDLCHQFRAGAFVNGDVPPAEQRFACVECIEVSLEDNVEARQRDATFGSLLAVVAVVGPQYSKSLTFHPAVPSTLFVLTFAALWLWYRAATRRNRPQSRRAAVLGLLDKRIGRAAAKSAARRPAARR